MLTVINSLPIGKGADVVKYYFKYVNATFIMLILRVNMLSGSSTDHGSPSSAGISPGSLQQAFAHSLANTSKDLYPALPGATHSPPWLDHHLRELQEKAMAGRPTHRLGITTWISAVYRQDNVTVMHIQGVVNNCCAQAE